MLIYILLNFSRLDRPTKDSLLKFILGSALSLCPYGMVGECNFFLCVIQVVASSFTHPGFIYITFDMVDKLAAENTIFAQRFGKPSYAS